MILVFEMTWTGAVHAPGNSATLQIVARAWPDQVVRVHAEATHLQELRRDAVLAALPNVEFVPVTVSPLWRGRTQIVAWRRLWQEFRTVRVALRLVPRGEGCLVFMISTTATGSFAAAWAARLCNLLAGPLARRRVELQVGFHGNLNDAAGWRSRNPLVRAFDTRAALEARHPVPTRFLVLETTIRTALAAVVPGAVARTDVLPLPINTVEVPATADGRLGSPVRIGFVGLGTVSKGMDTFLDIAARSHARWGDRVQFVHVGTAAPGADPAGFAVLAHPAATQGLPRSEFAARLASLHYVFLPFRRGYYDLSASGALIDALTWLKPIITIRVPLTEQFFDEFGDIGILCEDEAGLEAAVEAVLADPDADRYARQVAALRQARAARQVEILAVRYRRIVEQGFPELLGEATGRYPDGWRHDAADSRQGI